MATLAEVGKVLGIALELYPRFKRQMGARERAAMFKAYHMVLGDLDAGQLMQTIATLGGRQTFFPAAGEIRQTYFSLKDTAAGIPSAQDAWAETKALFRRGFGRRNPPTVESVSHPRVLRAIEGIGGWAALCDSVNDAADRARYLQAYEAYTKREQEDERMLPSVRAMVAELAAKLNAPQIGDGT